MEPEPNTPEMPTEELPVVQHVTLIPEGISSVRDIPGLTRATQGERAILQQMQQAIYLYSGRTVDEFWLGLWRTLARCLRMQTIYLVQVLWDLSSEDFLWMRVLFTADCTPQQPSAPVPLRSGVYAAALTRQKSAGLVLEKASRLDIKPGAYNKIPRSVESQVQNEGLTCFYINEVQELAEKRSSIVSTSGDGTNHFQLLPIAADSLGNRAFYLAFDHHGVCESIAAFEEMIEFIHLRLHQPLVDLIQLLLGLGEERSFAPTLPNANDRPLVQRCAVLHKPAATEQHPILSRDLVLSAGPTWPWHRRVAGLFTVEGATGAVLNKATEDIYRILDADFKKLCAADSERVLQQLWNWHLQVYLLAKEMNLPLRVSGCLLTVRAGEWEMYSLGTALPVLRLTQDDKAPIGFEIPEKNLCFLGYNPISTAGTGELANTYVTIPTERMKPHHFAPCFRLIGTFKRDLMLLISPGWLEQCNPGHGPGDYETRYTIQGFLASLHNTWAKNRGPYDRLAEQLAEKTAHFAAIVQDATLVIMQA